MKNKIIAFLLTIISLSSFAQDIPQKPNPPKLVNDFANILSSAEENALESKLVNFNYETSTQIVVVTVKSLNGLDKASFAYEIGEKWGVGNSKFDNGIVILVKNKTAREKGEVFIATGYGIEALVPDAIAKRIVENEMIPNFKQGGIYEGINAATDVLISLTKKEFTADAYSKKHNKKSKSSIFYIIIFIVFIISMFSRRGRGGGMGGILPFLLLGSMSRGSSFDNFSGGSGSFGGFGGGGFGGGGAGGSW